MVAHYHLVCSVAARVAVEHNLDHMVVEMDTILDRVEEHSVSAVVDKVDSLKQIIDIELNKSGRKTEFEKHVFL